MSEVKLDLSKLLGFRLLGENANVIQAVRLGAKLGGKPGIKPPRPPIKH